MRIGKKALIIFLWICLAFSFRLCPQPGRLHSFGARDSFSRKLSEPLDWLSAGLMEWGVGGQLQASARVVRLMIGEPGRWQLPVSVYSGVAQPGSNGLAGVGAARLNESITAQLYSPWSGMMNVGLEGQRRWADWGAHSGLRFVFQAGERLLSGYRVGAMGDPLSGKQQLLWNHYVVIGWVLHTGAWERSDPAHVGRAWLMVRGLFTYSSPDQLRWLYPLNRFRGIYGGVALGLGIEVSRVVHLRAGVTWPVHRPEWSNARSLTQFSFQYNWKN